MSYRTYTGESLDHVAFPLGGIGAGMFCITGSGGFSHFSLRNALNFFFEPVAFSAVCVKGEKNVARVLEGPVPRWKIFGLPGTGNGAGDKTYGLPRFGLASFTSSFPFATVRLEDDALPLKVEVRAWSPFVPGDADSSSLPAAGLEYTFRNTGKEALEAVYSFNARNFMNTGSGGAKVLDGDRGFVFWEPGAEDKPWDAGAFYASVDDESAEVNCCWFRGGWFDALTMAWKDVENGSVVSEPPVVEGDASPGASIFVPLTLAPGEGKTVRLTVSWHAPETNLTVGAAKEEDCACSDCGCKGPKDQPRHRPWYAGRFNDIRSVHAFWTANYDDLRSKSELFSRTFFDTTLPDELVDAVEANLTILKSPTVLRQMDGRLWCWEGCCDGSGCCPGSCTHVWNYAQAISNLFPALERTLRETEFGECQSEDGHQQFRAPLPIRPAAHSGHAASDGQLGGIIKVYRDWRISGDTEWMKSLWPKIKQSLDYCIETWDPEHDGTLREPHHNTYDIEFWGPDGMCTSFYLGALRAAIEMANVAGDDTSLYIELLDKGRRFIDGQLFNGEYYFQKVQWTGLRAGDPTSFAALAGGSYSPEAVDVLQSEGPKYQYGTGCISDGVLGFWLAAAAGLDDAGNADNVRAHLQSVYRYNLRRDLTDHANPQRPSFAVGDEGGLLLCTWPHGDKLSLPFPYSDEVWTGIEYQVASHMLLNGLVEEALDIVRTARERYDGRKRNPYNEYECGHWYARAMSSYGLLQGYSGARYDAVDRTLYLKPAAPGDFRAFIATATGFGTVGVREGKPFLDVMSGTIDVGKIDYQPAE